MSRKSIVNINTFFYPTGNTPAVCLTQDLPSGQNANILLLGCGDARNILFTTYADARFGYPQLDITCCDIEPAILARNILLFTLLVDDSRDSNPDDIWAIYYHLYLNDKSLNRLKSQASKLHSLASSIENWHGCEYGASLRFCDTKTFAKVKALWHLYAATGLSKRERKERTKHFQASLDRAREYKRRTEGWGTNLTTYRSAAPLGFKSLIDGPKLHQHFWQHGITEQDRAHIADAKHFNPMFGSLAGANSTLHYGTDPLLGFHLGAAYVPMVTEYLHDFKASHPINLLKVVKAARTQFRAWSSSFRKSIEKRLVLRFFTGDAVAFCHTLRHNKTEEGRTSAGWYCDVWGFTLLNLDGGDYAAPHSAPLSFDVIDTSNLVDHIGALSLLVSTVPLLAHEQHSTLHAEFLVRREGGFMQSIESLLCGEYATISLLLGLFPVSYWTNATASASMDEAFFSTIMKATGTDKSMGGQTRNRISWKVSEHLSSFQDRMALSGSLRLNEASLVGLLFNTYLTMFREENHAFLFANLQSESRHGDLNPYHRGSFAIFLSYLKGRFELDWDKVVEAFLDRVEQDRTLLIGSNFVQELYLYLHLSNVYTATTLKSGNPFLRNTKSSKYLATWRDVPSVVCITIEVPRAKLKPITDIDPARLGTPFLICSFSSSSKLSLGGWENLFAALQLGFGEVKTYGSRDSDGFAVEIVEDPLAWTGSSPLIASFLAPTWLVLQEPQTACLCVRAQTTVQTMATLGKALGPTLSIFETKLGNSEVYISCQRPGHSAPPSLGFAQRSSNIPPTNTAVSTTMTANLGADSRQVTSLTCRIDVLSQKAKALLASNVAIKMSHTSPLSALLTAGMGGPRCAVAFPMPVQHSRSRVRIARKSSYVDIISPCISARAEARAPDFMFPLSVRKINEIPVPVNWNMHHLHLDSLPVLDTKRTQDMDWLVTHTTLMFSARERRLREEGIESNKIMYNVRDSRVAFKDGLFSIFMHFSGLQGERARVFALDKDAAGDVHLILFVHALRLDLANSTVVLDAAVLPLTESLVRDAQSVRFLQSLGREKICNISVSVVELRLWKTVLPAFVERCRTWHHLADSCEYLPGLRVPRVEGLEDGQSPLCSCGNGQVPKKFMPGLKILDLDSILTKHAVRAAIPACFCPPYVEDCIGSDHLNPFHEAVSAAASAMPRHHPPGDTGRCAGCGSGEARPGVNESGQLMSCARCRAVSYCSAQCQKSHWRAHKNVCIRRD